MKKQMLPVLITAAMGCFLFVGCGDDQTAEHGAETTSTRRATTTEMTTTEATVQTNLTGDSHDDEMTSSEKTRVTDSTTGSGLIDRAESALDDVGDTITSVLTEATREVHNSDLMNGH